MCFCKHLFSLLILLTYIFGCVEIKENFFVSYLEQRFGGISVTYDFFTVSVEK